LLVDKSITVVKGNWSKEVSERTTPDNCIKWEVSFLSWEKASKMKLKDINRNKREKYLLTMKSFKDNNTLKTSRFYI